MTLGKPRDDRWQLVVVYRGLHYPICKMYLGKLDAMKSDLEEMRVDIVIASTDPEEKARKFAEELGFDI